MLDLLIRGRDKVVGDGTLTEDESMERSNRKGNISAWFVAGPETPSRHLTGMQVPPEFCIIRSDVTEAQVAPYMKAWRQDLDWALSSTDTAADAWHGELYAKAVRKRDNRGRLTQPQAENFLLGWNLTNLSFGTNRAEGDFTIFDLATSQRFWEDDLGGMTFSELGYDESTGQHQIRLSYGGIAKAGRRSAGVTSVDQKVYDAVAAKTEVVRHNTSQNRIDFNVWRGIPNYVAPDREDLPGDDMIAALKWDVARRLEKHLGMRRWRVKHGTVDGVIGLGGFVEMTPQDLQGVMQDYCDG